VSGPPPCTDTRKWGLLKARNCKRAEGGSWGPLSPSPPYSPESDDEGPPANLVPPPPPLPPPPRNRPEPQTGPRGGRPGRRPSASMSRPPEGRSHRRAQRRLWISCSNLARFVRTSAPPSKLAFWCFPPQPGLFCGVFAGALNFPCSGPCFACARNPHGTAGPKPGPVRCRGILSTQKCPSSPPETRGNLVKSPCSWMGLFARTRRPFRAPVPACWSQTRGPAVFVCALWGRLETGPAN